MMKANIREREQRFRAITDSALDAIILIDDRGEISFLNPASERIFGYNSSEVMGKNVHELLAPPKYHAAYRSAFKNFAVSGQGNALGRITQLVARRKYGEEFLIELSLSGFQMNGRWHGGSAGNSKRSSWSINGNQSYWEGNYNTCSVSCGGYTGIVIAQGFPDTKPACVLHKPYNMEALKKNSSN
ncbi:MAG: PAS domain S-box protein [Desulfomonilaceae bacterium]|jgi:PAS domain S-box-containing protein